MGLTEYKKKRTFKKTPEPTVAGHPEARCSLWCKNTMLRAFIMIFALN